MSPEPPLRQPPSPAADLEAASTNVDNEEEDLDKTPDVSREVQQINSNKGLQTGYAPSRSTGASFPPVGMKVPEVQTGADSTSVDEAKVIDDFMKALEIQNKEEARFMQTRGGNHLLPSLAAEHLPVVSEEPGNKDREQHTWMCLITLCAGDSCEGILKAVDADTAAGCTDSHWDGTCNDPVR